MTTEMIYLNLGVFGEVECEITFKASKGEPASAHCPSEPSEMEIESIVAYVKTNPVDISKLLTKENYESIESQIWESLE